MKSLLLIILGLYGSWHITDLSSSNFIFSAVALFGVFIFLCSLLIWLVTKAGLGGKASKGGSVSGDFGGGDGGC